MLSTRLSDKATPCHAKPGRLAPCAVRSIRSADIVAPAESDHQHRLLKRDEDMAAIQGSRRYRGLAARA